MPSTTAQPPISFIASLVLSATNSTLENLAVNLVTAFANIYLMSKTKDQTCLNPWLDISIFRTIHTNIWKFAELTYTLGTMKLEKGKNRDSFSNSGPWLPTESMNDFHSLNFKHIFDQLDATNFNQCQNLTFRSA